MMSPDEIPEPVRATLTKMLGSPPRLDRLGGMSRGPVLRASGADGGPHLIVKGRASAAEARIYREDAGLLSAHGIPTPRLYWSEQIDGAWWLVLEEIPEALPRARWLADPELLAILHRLHHSPLTPPAHYQPGWSQELTEAGLNWFDDRERAELRLRLEELRRTCQPLFEPICPISGDPNPLNWGARADGSLVLFDWERCTLGTPAIDLAITIPVFGSESDFEQVASVYLSAGNLPATAGEMNTLARRIKLAKAWVLVEFLANAHTQTTGADDADSKIRSTARWAASELPDWLATVFSS